LLTRARLLVGLIGLLCNRSYSVLVVSPFDSCLAFYDDWIKLALPIDAVDGHPVRYHVGSTHGRLHHALLSRSDHRLVRNSFYFKLKAVTNEPCRDVLCPVVYVFLNKLLRGDLASGLLVYADLTNVT
jgi:hypothetical protein